MKLMINHQTHYQYSDWAKNSMSVYKNDATIEFTSTSDGVAN
ncbi:MAG: hypothetical protein GAK29_01192 [Acinetobacter bereziniae]|uniref:Uncharacterized protein n=1 Tax=Acinetobacter bereziniae TaxID=106648 RepID=A0A833PH89_ACIBZ|nr:MAG: hypothetical protein GAK29_01192 [Acinetobacter bereziniae]